MAREPQRSPEPRPLGAAIVPVERALRARAEDLQARQEYGALHGVSEDSTEAMIRAALIVELRALAEELKYW
jgi:hypothetical protein